MVDQNVVDREVGLEAVRRGLISREALRPFFQKLREDPSRSFAGHLIAGGVLSPELGSELERLAFARVAGQVVDKAEHASLGATPSASLPRPAVPASPAGSGTPSGTISSSRLAKAAHRPMSMPANTILDLDLNAPDGPGRLASPAAADRPDVPALGPGDSHAPGVSADAFRASRTYVDAEAEGGPGPSPGRTMIEEPMELPSDPAVSEGGRTMMEEPFEAPPEPLPAEATDHVAYAAPPEAREGALPDPGRTMMEEDWKPPGDTGGPDAPGGQPALSPSSVADTPHAVRDSRRETGDTKRTPAVSPARRGPRDMEGPAVKIGGYFGDYEVLSQLGEGAMGQVFRAKRRNDGLNIALKVMRGGLVSNPKVRERFLREAKAAKLIEHPNVVRFIDAGMIGNDQFLAMEFVEGRSLQALLGDQRGQPLPLLQACELFRQITAGLAAAHEAGVIHRDLKPENILLAKGTEGAGPAAIVGTCKITDFGLARREDESMLLTRPGQVMGSPYYMAPEQGQGLAVDARADLYSLGAILFCLVTGRVPFPFPSATEVIHAHCEAERPDPRDLNPDVPPGLAAFILRLLARDAAARPQTARLALQEFEQVFRAEVTGVSPAPAARASGEESSDDLFAGRQLVDALPTGTVVGKLTIEGVLGAGGMGAVYAAVHESGRRSALKILPPNLAQDPKRVASFLREAELGARIKHPNVVETREYGNDPRLGIAYIEQELVEGTSLEGLIKTGVLQDETLLINIARGVALALEGVHAAGIIHRDLKPANVLLAGEFLSRPDANVKLIDFGLAIAKKDITTSGKQEFAGTPTYMAPEQSVTDGLVDERSDLYCLGATLYHAACGVPPFEGATPAAISYQHQRAVPKPPRQHNESLSEAFATVIEILLGKAPEDRFQSAKALVAELHRTTPEGKLAKPQVHAKYRTRGAADAKPLRVESHAEPAAPPPRAAIYAAAFVVVVCGAALVFQVLSKVTQSSGGDTAPPPPVVTQPPPPPPRPQGLTEQDLLQKNVSDLDTAQRRKRREIILKRIDDEMRLQHFLGARQLLDKLVSDDATNENLLGKVRQDLAFTARVFDEDLADARRCALGGDWAGAKDKLEDARLFVSRAEDADRLSAVTTEVDELKKQRGHK